MFKMPMKYFQWLSTNSSSFNCCSPYRYWCNSLFIELPAHCFQIFAFAEVSHSDMLRVNLLSVHKWKTRSSFFHNFVKVFIWSRFTSLFFFLLQLFKGLFASEKSHLKNKSKSSCQYKNLINSVFGHFSRSDHLNK